MSETSSMGSLESAATMQHKQGNNNNTCNNSNNNAGDYPDAIASIELLRQHTQRLATRLQRTHQEMSSQQQQAVDFPLIERQAQQFMRTFIAAKPQVALQAAPIQQQHQRQNNIQAVPVPLQVCLPANHFQNSKYVPPSHRNANAQQIQQQQPQQQPQHQQLQQQQQQQQKKAKRKQKTREELSEQVDTLTQQVSSLKELVLELSKWHPDVEYYADLLIKNNVVLSLMPWPHLGNRQQGGQRSRHESEVSSTTSNSSALSQPQQSSGTENGAAPSPRQKRTRYRKKQRNEKQPPRSMKTELDAMRGYINRIVQQYAGSDAHLPPELIFKGDFGDLEAHAQRLVTAGYGRIVEDEIRVNRKNNRQAFISMSTDRETLDRDGIVLLPVARRYAFDGDTVRAFVMNPGATVTRPNDAALDNITGGKASLSLADDEEPSEETESQDTDDENVVVISSDNCPKAFVIGIVRQTELRQIVGNISFTNPNKLCENENTEEEPQLFYKFRPFDLRMPMLYISQASCASHMANKQPDEICGLLYVAHVLETDCNGHCIAELVQPVGRVGNLDDELKAILFHNNLRDIVPFEERFNEMYAQPAAPLGSDDLLNRLDMRKRCVFTIDPLTARDLDDAMSIEQLAENEFEVGVHISDVAHYLQENSELDNIVKERSTSIYLANEVIHMLPKPLCFRCSLLPGEDKFSFSVFWRMDGNGKQLAQPRFTRSVINSCTQFAYEHAQKIIDNPQENFTADDFPNILNGFSVNDVVQRVAWLNGIARNMRSQRFENGALTINNAKVRFTLDPQSGEPIGFEVEKLREANHMIEEYMLLANQAVARFIHDAYPNISVLRNHPPPLTKSLKSLREKLLAQGLDLDYGSSKALHESMLRLCREAADPVAMSACLSQLLMKPMARANYFCSEGKTLPSDLWHYALAIPIYTHFTSPIRRYPDILVHRLLAAALNYCPAPGRSCDELAKLTKIANERKFNAKQAGDDSSNLFFKRYVSNRQAIYMRAVVIEIFQHMMNVVTLESGHVISINYKMQRVLIDMHNAPNHILVAEHNMKQPPYKLQLLSVVPIRLIIWDGKLTGFLLTADQRQKGPSMEHPGASNSNNNSKRQLQPQRNNYNHKTAKNQLVKHAQQQQQQHNQEQQQRRHQQQQQQQQQRIFALRKNSS
ncbi:DIS3-like exonuclease 2 [Drosophila sulfurigaster albostrigata]|uniref:DIS3-like exonuclease 2 n=1 Tax=Drosophila sulfurigaster albostrigata TaxID=89887 RepID=UPI002D21C1B1|nr:DIS3-like exonuclease 2 [Drosophila sulfurigaster albostrigata]